MSQEDTKEIAPAPLKFGSTATRQELTDQVRQALQIDHTIDIVTTGAKTGKTRRTEIWFTRIGERIIICGTPAAEGGNGPIARRDWLANLKANPGFLFCLKESVKVELAATAIVITEAAERRALMSAPETKWYRDQVDSVEDLVAGSPIVEVIL